MGIVQCWRSWGFCSREEMFELVVCVLGIGCCNWLVVYNTIS